VTLGLMVGRWTRRVGGAGALACPLALGGLVFAALPAIAIQPGAKSQLELLARLGDLATGSVSVYADGQLLDSAWCSGTMLTPYVMLTAAHCLKSDKGTPAVLSHANVDHTWFRPSSEDYYVAQGAGNLYSGRSFVVDGVPGRILTGRGDGSLAYGKVVGFMTTNYPAPRAADLAVALIKPSHGAFTQSSVPLATAQTTLARVDFNFTTNIVNRPHAFSVGHSYFDKGAGQNEFYRQRLGFTPVLTDGLEEITTTEGREVGPAWIEARIDVAVASRPATNAAGQIDDPSWLLSHGFLVTGDSGGGLYGFTNAGAGLTQIGVNQLANPTYSGAWAPIADNRSFIDGAVAALSSQANKAPGQAASLPALPQAITPIPGGKRKTFAVQESAGWVYLDPATEGYQEISVSSAHLILGLDLLEGDISVLRFETFEGTAATPVPLSFFPLSDGQIYFAEGTTRLRIHGPLDTDVLGNVTLGLLAIQTDETVDAGPLMVNWDSITAAPEPESLLMMLSGLLALSAVTRLHRKKR
jgi:hypothetical protein